MNNDVFDRLSQFRDDENQWTCKEIYVDCASDLYDDTGVTIDLATCIGVLPRHPAKLQMDDTKPVSD
jgi:hypothetical protein